MVLANWSLYYTWKNIKSAYNNNKFKISASHWNDEFDKIHSYSTADIQDYFEFIIKKHDAKNPPYKLTLIKSKTVLFSK